MDSIAEFHVETADLIWTIVVTIPHRILKTVAYSLLTLYMLIVVIPFGWLRGHRAYREVSMVEEALHIKLSGEDGLNGS